MTSYRFRNSKNQLIVFTEKEVSKALSAMFGTEVKTRHMHFWRGVSLLSLALFVFFGWEYEIDQRLADNGDVTKEYYVQELRWDLPPYKVEQFQRAEYIKQMISEKAIFATSNYSNIHSVRNGKVER